MLYKWVIPNVFNHKILCIADLFTFKIKVNDRKYGGTRSQESSGSWLHEFVLYRKQR